MLCLGRRLMQVNNIKHIKRFCTLKVNGNVGKNDENEFRPVYKFKFIEIVASVQRMKIYQTTLTLAGVTLAEILWNNQLIDAEIYKSTALIGITGCMVLYTIGFLTNRVIGFLYLNEKEKIAKIAFVDFWGRRKEEIIQLNDIMPICDMQEAFTDGLYSKLVTYSNPSTKYKINLKYCTIYDKKGLDRIINSA